MEVSLATWDFRFLLAEHFLTHAPVASTAPGSEFLAAPLPDATWWYSWEALLAVLFLAQALLARIAPGVVSLAANWWLLNTQGLSLRRKEQQAEEEPHEEVLFGFPIGGCFHPSAGVTDWSGRFLVGYFLCL